MTRIRFQQSLDQLKENLLVMAGLAEQAIQRAIARSGDLADGLKTPLAILAQEAQRARGADQHVIAAAIDHFSDSRRHQELAVRYCRHHASEGRLSRWHVQPADLVALEILR